MDFLKNEASEVVNYNPLLSLIPTAWEFKKHFLQK
jgi:hypothetical protein